MFFHENLYFLTDLNYIYTVKYNKKTSFRFGEDFSSALFHDKITP